MLKHDINNGIDEGFHLPKIKKHLTAKKSCKVSFNDL